MPSWPVDLISRTSYTVRQEVCQELEFSEGTLQGAANIL